MFNNNLNEPSNDKQTAIEHEYIILHYLQTGYLHRFDPEIVFVNNVI